MVNQGSNKIVHDREEKRGSIGEATISRTARKYRGLGMRKGSRKEIDKGIRLRLKSTTTLKNAKLYDTGLKKRVPFSSQREEKKRRGKKSGKEADCLAQESEKNGG